jgi:hypothetical protein
MAKIAPKTQAKHKPDDPAQYKRFLEAAQNTEAADSEEAADRAFKKVAKPKRPTKK